MKNEKQSQQFDEFEIDLKDYLQVIRKRKNGILIIFLVVVITTAIISFTMPKTYLASAFIKIGKIKEQKLETLSDLKTVFEQESVLKELAKKINLPPGEKIDKKLLNFEQAKEGELIKVSGKGKTPEEALKLTEKALEIIIDRHEKFFEKAKKVLDFEIETIKKQKEKTRKDIEQLEEEIKRLEGEIANYEKEVKLRSNAYSEGQGLIAQSYIYLLAQAKNQKEEKEKQILNLKQEINNLDLTLQEKEYENVYLIRNTTIEIPAILPEEPIAPNKKINLTISAILGVFLGIFWAFGREYFEKEKLS